MKTAVKLLALFVAFLVVPLVAIGATINTGQAVNTSAPNGALHVNYCATADGGSSYSLPYPTRSFELQNQGPNACYCTIDGTTTPALYFGHRIAGLATGATSLADSWAVDCTQSGCTAVKCIAATADQVDGGCLQLTVVK